MAQIDILFLLDSVEPLLIYMNGVERGLERGSAIERRGLNILKAVLHTSLYVLWCQRGLHLTGNPPYFFFL
jgi:hypothetical protein